ncbi:competence protein ComF [Deltaproteobacteria bacterium]|nr:competence protein ComF [Deltaproteobacteria bacterium]
MLDLVATRECLACASGGEAVLCPDCAGEIGARLKALPARNTLFSAAWSLGAYSGAIGALVRRAKFNLDLRAADLLVEQLQSALREGFPAPVDAVVYVPTTPWRLMWRGFHLPERLAEVAADAAGVPVVPALRRTWGLAQAGRTHAERVAAGAELFRVRFPVSGHVLLVDDVLTSGASAHGAAAELLVAGATSVSCLVLAAAGPLRRVPVGIS